MIKTLKTPKNLFKPKPTTTKTIDVGIDVFGNAIPDNVTAQIEASGKALRVVKRQQVALKPSRKKSTKKLAVVTPQSPSLLTRLLPATWTKPSVKTIAHDGISERLEVAFKRLHHEFNEREQQLEVKMHAIQQQHLALANLKQKKRGLLLSLVAAGMLAGGYMLYVLTNMQNSMTSMSGNISTMNGHMGAMASDTQNMTQNIQAMNESMYYMNNNVGYMSGNVAQMNQKVGTLAQAAAPMGEAAATMNPFMKAFKSFMPF